MDDFEQFLKQQPPRALPPEWRAGILAKAMTCREASVEPARAASSPAPEHPWWLAWLWPSPGAWAGVACAWVVILGLNAASESDGAERIATTACAPLDFPATLAAQQRFIDRLFRCEQSTPEPTDALLPRGIPGAFIRNPTPNITA